MTSLARPSLAPLRSLALVLALFAAVAGLLHARGRTLYNADQAVVALMAQDILYHGAHPVFFDGSEYAGTLEQHLLALAFAFLPDRVAVQQTVVALELAAGVALLWLATRRAFGERAVLAAGLYLALGPYFFFYRGLSSSGPYAPLFALGAAMLALLVWIEERAAAGVPPIWAFAGLGLVLGLAWWTHPAAAAYVVAAAAALVGGAARRRLTPSSALAALLGLALGSLPWWARNLETGWASVRGPEGAPLAWTAAAGRLGDLFGIGVPVLLGARPPWAPGAPVWAAALALLLLAALSGFALFLLVRRQGPPRTVALVALVLLPATAALALFSPRAQFTEPRVLVGWYVALAPLAGALLAWPSAPRALRAVLAAGLVALHLAGHLAAPRVARSGSYEQVAAHLAARGVEAVYTSYWTAYMVTFLSATRVVGTPFGTGTVVRRAADQAHVHASPSPAFFFDWIEADLGQDAVRFATFLRRGGFSHRAERLPWGVLFTGVAPEAVAVARRCSCVPSGAAGDAEWLGGAGPARIAAGATAVYRIRLRNRSSLPWGPNMHLAYHWLRPDGTVAVYDGRRTLPPRLPGPGKTLTLDVAVDADVPPGDYVLVIDAVEEGVAWFESLGLAPPRFAVRVAP